MPIPAGSGRAPTGRRRVDAPLEPGPRILRSRVARELRGAQAEHRRDWWRRLRLLGVGERVRRGEDRLQVDRGRQQDAVRIADLPRSAGMVCCCASWLSAMVASQSCSDDLPPDQAPAIADASSEATIRRKSALARLSVLASMRVSGWFDVEVSAWRVGGVGRGREGHRAGRSGARWSELRACASMRAGERASPISGSAAAARGRARGPGPAGRRSGSRSRPRGSTGSR